MECWCTGLLQLCLSVASVVYSAAESDLSFDIVYPPLFLSPSGHFAFDEPM